MNIWKYNYAVSKICNTKVETSTQRVYAKKKIFLSSASIIKEKSKAKNNHRVKIEYIELSHIRTTETAGKVIVTKTPIIIII